MAAGYQNIYLNQGETFTTSLTLTDQNGEPYDLSYFSIYSQAKKSYYSTNVIINFNSAIQDASNGIVTLSANSAVTSNISPGILVYDTVIVDNLSGNITRVLEGQIFVSPAVTIVS